MKNLLSTVLYLSVFALVACNGGEASKEGQGDKYVTLQNMNIENLNKEIEKREAALNKDSMTVNKQLAAQLMEAYAVYGEKFSNYSEAADRLFKAGELAMGLGHKVEAIKYFEKVYFDFPDFEKRPYALFMKAFVLENQAMEYDQAREIYLQFIQEYPNHPMADDAEYSIQNMGKSPEELIREFEIRDSLEAAGNAS